MIRELNNLDLKFRKLKLSDYKQFSELFYKCFKKKISYKFFKWRYFSDKKSFCYGVFVSSNLVANIGIKLIKINNKYLSNAFSRHSSMVSKEYRNIKIFSHLSRIVKKKFIKNVQILLMWPNKKNFSNFGLQKKNIIKKKFYLYKTHNLKEKKKSTINLKINKLNFFKNYIYEKDDFILKNYKYFKERYNVYKSREYVINKFEKENFLSFFVLKKNIEKSKINFILLDHFGSRFLIREHMSKLISENKSIVFWSEKKINKSNFKLINHINLHIGLLKIRKTSVQWSKLMKKTFMPGDTDSFISIN